MLDFDTVEEYRSQAQLHFSATIGRVAGRIRDARFTLDYLAVILPANHGRHHLHGGSETPFDQVDWTAEALATPDGPSVRFSRVSPDGEEGYPGELSVSVSYTLTPTDELRIGYQATTDRTTPLSMTNHSYWNLAGAGSPSILDHADLRRSPIDTPPWTPTSFRSAPSSLSRARPSTSVSRASWVIASRRSRAPGHWATTTTSCCQGTGRHRLAARLRHPGSGRVLEVRTTQPCMNVYSGNMMAPSVGKMGRAYPTPGRASVLEPAGFLNAVNTPSFEPVWLQPGETYRQSMTFRLTTDR